MDTDVLIVGAGPTGLMLANQLARRGIKPIIIDRHSGPAQQSRAMVVQARTLEIYAKMGLADKALALGTIGAGANMWANGKWAARIPIGDMGKGQSLFPFVLMLGQDDNEKIMGELLNAQGVEVLWNTELVALEQQAGHVDATINSPSGQRRIAAAWVAGCDGSRSPVREMAGIGFPGAPYEHVFFVADTEATGAMKRDELNVYLWQDGFHLFFPMKGKDRWRVIGILPRHLRDKGDTLTFDEVVPELKTVAGADLNFKECSWFSTYHIHHRAAERFRAGRSFILGDAAHVHSPMGGQGMNTGLQDAYNLAWKLALVVQGTADAALLDSFEQERIPVARQLLKTTDRAFQAVVSDGWLPSLFRTRIMARVVAFAMRFARLRRLAFSTISQLGISYPNSALSRSSDTLPSEAPAAGERFPWLHLKLRADGQREDLFASLDDTKFNLIVFGQTAPAVTYGGLLHTLAVPDDPGNGQELERVGIPPVSYFLLRPDGHIGRAGTRLIPADIESYFSGAVRIRGGA